MTAETQHNAEVYDPLNLGFHQSALCGCEGTREGDGMAAPNWLPPGFAADFSLGLFLLPRTGSFSWRGLQIAFNSCPNSHLLIEAAWGAELRHIWRVSGRGQARTHQQCLL